MGILWNQIDTERQRRGTLRPSLRGYRMAAQCTYLRSFLLPLFFSSCGSVLPPPPDQGLLFLCSTGYNNTGYSKKAVLDTLKKQQQLLQCRYEVSEVTERKGLVRKQNMISVLSSSFTAVSLCSSQHIQKEMNILPCCGPWQLLNYADSGHLGVPALG